MLYLIHKAKEGVMEYIVVAISMALRVVLVGVVVTEAVIITFLIKSCMEMAERLAHVGSALARSKTKSYPRAA